MKKRLIFAIAAVTLIALATGSMGLSRSLQLTREGAEAAPAPPPMVATPLPSPFARPNLAPRSPLMTPPPAQAPKPKNLASAKPPAPALAPPIVLVPRGEKLPPTQNPTAVARALPMPAPPDPFAAPSAQDFNPPTPLVSVGSAPPQAGPPPTAVPVRPPSPADSNGVWEERPSQQEQPQIFVRNDSRLAGEMIITLATPAQRPRRWSWRDAGVVIDESIAPGEYTYEVRGPIYRSTGQPDLAGTLRCQKYKLYRVRLYQRAWWEGWGTIHRDFGDPSASDSTPNANPNSNR